MSNTVRSHRMAWTWGILLIFAVAVRLGAAAFLTGLNAPPAPGEDEFEYDLIAWNLVQGKGYVGVSPDVRDSTGADREHVTAYRPPVTPVVFATVYTIAGHSYAAIRLGEAVIGGFATLLVSVIATRVFSASAGWLSGVIYAIWDRSRAWLDMRRPLAALDATSPGFNDPLRRAAQSVDLYVITFAGGETIQRLTHGANVTGVPSWSPDGTTLGFSSDSDVYVIGVDGTNLTNITKNRPGKKYFPVWAP